MSDNELTTKFAGVAPPLSYEERAEAVALTPLVVNDPEAAAREIVYWRSVARTVTRLMLGKGS